MKLTWKGRKLLARAVPIWKSHHEEVERLLGQGAADPLRKTLRALG
jgi:hypothetical protein